jgi:hypothetical protein
MSRHRQSTAEALVAVLATVVGCRALAASAEASYEKYHDGYMCGSTSATRYVESGEAHTCGAKDRE